jgi:hypothetical protein
VLGIEERRRLIGGHARGEVHQDAAGVVEGSRRCGDNAVRGLPRWSRAAAVHERPGRTRSVDDNDGIHRPTISEEQRGIGSVVAHANRSALHGGQTGRAAAAA